MSTSPALWAVGIAAGVGIALAVNHANAAEASPPDETEPPSPPAPIPDPLPAPSEAPGVPTAGGSPGGPGGAGSGTPTTPGPPPGPNIPDPTGLLPPELQMIDLSGLEVAHYDGQVDVAPGPYPFHRWHVQHTINDMDLYMYVSVEHPEEWIAYFWHVDPVGSTPPAHAIVYQVSDTPGKDWMLHYIAGDTKTAADHNFE